MSDHPANPQENPANPQKIPVQRLQGRVIDCRGMRCPAPIIHLGRALPEVAVGELLGVAATDVAARVDVPAFCRMRGQAYVGETLAEDGVPVFWVRRDT